MLKHFALEMFKGLLAVVWLFRFDPWVRAFPCCTKSFTPDVHIFEVFLQYKFKIMQSITLIIENALEISDDKEFFVSYRVPVVEKREIKK